MTEADKVRLKDETDSCVVISDPCVTCQTVYKSVLKSVL
jgi:hypothetical protein